MTIQTIIRGVLATRLLTRHHQEQINMLLWQRRYTEADIQALEQLTDAVLSQQVQVEEPNLKSGTAA